MLTPKDYIGALMELAQDRRGEFKEIKFITEIRASLLYQLPLAEVFSCEKDRVAIDIKMKLHLFWRCHIFQLTCTAHSADGR